jgi:hypothetical protein
MKKPTDTSAPETSARSQPVRARLRAMAQATARAARTANRGGDGGYEAARVSAELATIAERRTAFDR